MPEPGPMPEPEPTQPPALTPLEPGTQSASAMAGRVTTLEVAGDAAQGIQSLRILERPDHGHLSINPNNTLALVLSEDPGQTRNMTFQYEATFEDGRTQVIDAKIDVERSAEPEGWGMGDFYMLEQSPSGAVVVEHGDNHRKVYLTQGDHGLTRADIAKAEGLSVEQISNSWLRDHSEYGASADKALATDVGMSLWQEITGRREAPNSNWLLFERGYEYDDLGRVISRGATGESALHPQYVGAYGEGQDPKLSSILMYQDKSSNIVVQNVDVSSMTILGGKNILLDHMSFTKNMVNLKDTDGLTVQNSDIFDVVRDEPVNNKDVWNASNNRTSGMYLAGVDGGLIRNNVFDRNGWAEGYDYNMSLDSPMPPSMYNHNLYVQHSSLDITVRDNVFMRGASFGAQVRPGGVIEGNTFIDNNAAVNFFSGFNYTLLLDNVITSAGYKQVSDYQGALSYGIDNFGKLGSLIGNIVTHLADPANPDEQAEKIIAQRTVAELEGNYTNDTIVYNWLSSKEVRPNQNVGDLDSQVLDRTTIQNFAADLLDKDKATIADLADFLRAQAGGQLDNVADAEMINAFFREGFGLDTELRSTSEMLRFVPDDRGEGMRWDNRLNWDTEDLPGSQDGDSVDLGGNLVHFSAMTTTVDEFIFGEGGNLQVNSGRLNIAGDLSVDEAGNLLEITNAGQVWIDGYADENRLNIRIDGGRFANTADVTGSVHLALDGDGQVILASSGDSFDLGAGSSLSISGTKGRIGFDGGTDDTAVLRMSDDATLTFEASKDGLGHLAEFRSGAMGDASMVTSGVRLDGTLSIDLSEWKDSNKAGTSVLLDVDQLVGSFEKIDIEGLGKKQDALVRIDYVRDEVSLVIGQDGKGSGDIRMVTSGEEAFVDYSDDASLAQLWDALYAPMSDPMLQ